MIVVDRVRLGSLLTAAGLALAMAPSGEQIAAAVEARPSLDAAPQLGQRIALDDLVQYAVEANPSIAAARAFLKEVLARSRIETSYPAPSFTTTWWQQQAAANKPQTWEFMLEQGVPFPGKLGALGRVRSAEEGAARIVVERAIRDVTLRVRESAVEIGYLRTAREVAAGNRELLGRLRAAGETGYAADRTGLYDLLRSQAQQSQTVFDEQLLAELEATEVARLNSLLSRPPDAPLGPIDLRPGRSLVVGLAEIMDLAASGRQEVRLAQEEGKKSRAEKRLAKFAYLPDLMLGAGYMQESALRDMEATGQWKLQLGLSLPVRFDKNSAAHAAAAAGEDRAAALEREAADATRAEVRENFFRLRNAERLVGLYRDLLLPQALAALDLADAWFRAGQGSFADFIEAGTLGYNFQLALARAGADREKYLARLEALAERPLTAPFSKEAAAPGAAAADVDWSAVLERIEKLRASFADAGPGSPAGESVLAADLARLAALGAPADDGGAAAAALFPEVALGDLELLAVTRNPLVLGAGRSLRATLEQYGQVTALDEVLRRYAAATGSLMTGVGGAMGDAIRSRFPFPGMLALKGEIVTQDARAAREDLERARRDALAEARRLYWGLDYARRSVALRGEIQDLLNQSVQAVRARYESGSGKLADLARAQIDLEKNRTELATAVEECGVIETGLRSLLALPRAAAIGQPRGTESPPPSRDPAALAALALERRQELRRMRAMAARMERMIQMSELDVVPGFSLDFSLFENQPLTQAGTLAMAAPFPAALPAAEGTGTPLRAFSGRASGYVRETRERLAALVEEIRAAEETTVARVREAWFAYDRARREEQLWAVRVADLNRLASETLERSYRAGRSTLPEVLEAARSAREAALEAARRHADAGQAWAALEMTIGAPLPGTGDFK